jgi:hypothetical protein
MAHSVSGTGVASPAGAAPPTQEPKGIQMSLKLKALGVSALAALAVSAVSVMNASATAGGHFVSETTHTDIKGIESGGHVLHLTNHGLSGLVGCDIDRYTGTAESATKTVTQITIKPEYEDCYTTADPDEPITVDVNGCTYEFTVAAGTTSSTEQTAHVRCPAGQTIKVTHPLCTVTVHPQTINTGLTYTHQTNANGKNEVTMDVNAQFTTTRHGLCQFIAPTNGTGTLAGSVTVQGFSGPNQVSITAT